jgi:peptidoglycan L-alanyl-D-glutamate endopeptidase CwlK
MIDKPSLDRINLLHPKIREEVKALVEQANAVTGKEITIRVVQGLRTIKEQNNLYAIGRTKPGKRVTNAKGGSSYHNYGLSIDFAFLVKDKGQISWDDKKDWDGDKIADWLEVVQIFVKAGYEWGGNWKSIKDNPHFQKTFGYTWQQLLAKYNKKDFIPGTEYVNI